ncbi:hypothetical protein ISCGN_029713 [Ixodes scapularis]
MGTQTSPDDLHLPSRSPSKPPRAAPKAPPPNRKVNAALPASAPEQEMSSPAQPAASTSRGRGLPPHTSAPQRKPGEVPKQSTSKGQLPATADEPMDECGSRSDEEALLSRSESTPSASGTYSDAVRRGPAPRTESRVTQFSLEDLAGPFQAPKQSAGKQGAPGGTCESRCLESGVSTDPEPCGFARPCLAVRGFPVSGEKGILVVEPSPGGPAPRSESKATQVSPEILAADFRAPAPRQGQQLLPPVPGGGTCESRCLESGVSTDPEPCGFARPRLAVRGFPVSEEKGILVVEPSPG